MTYSDLTSCKSCGSYVPFYSNVCPKCTKKNFSPYGRLFRGGLLLSAIILGIYLLNLSRTNQADPAKELFPTRMNAIITAEEIISNKLKAPATAKFQTTPDFYQKDSLYEIKGYVDSQNSFGAMLRSKYFVRLIYVPSNDSWTIVNADLY